MVASRPMSLREAEAALRSPYAPTPGPRKAHVVPLVAATPASLGRLARLVDDPAAYPVEIVRWPAQGWRPIDEGSADQGGVVEGLFETEWRGSTLHGRNHAVGDAYVFGWSDWPDGDGAEPPPATRRRALSWRANYHPDGGQLVWPVRPGSAFRVALAPPGDDVVPESFVAFRLDGRQGLYIPPGVWHGPFIPEADQTAFHDRQGRVHARVSVDFPREFGLYLEIPL